MTDITNPTKVVRINAISEPPMKYAISTGTAAVSTVTTITFNNTLIQKFFIESPIILLSINKRAIRQPIELHKATTMVA